MSSPNEPRIVIRKKRVSHEGGHSGGAWKIAYADFMTAMMVFFLVMWILSLVPKSELKDLADYFRRPLISAITGDPYLPASKSVIPGGAPTPIPNKAALPDTAQLIPQHSRGDSQGRDRARLENLRAKVDQLIEQKPDLRQYQPQMLMDMTSEGLRIQILDDQKRPMFATGSARLHPEMIYILKELSPLINEIPNGISISGHTDATQYVTGEFAYSNWELSADRANSARQALVNGGLEESKVRRIQGLASTINLVKDDPYAPINRRISIVVLNEEAEAELNRLNAVPGLSQEEIDETLKQARERNDHKNQSKLGYVPLQSSPVVSSMYLPALAQAGTNKPAIPQVADEPIPASSGIVQTSHNNMPETEVVPVSAEMQNPASKVPVLMVNGLEKDLSLFEQVLEEPSFASSASASTAFSLPHTADTIIGSIIGTAAAAIMPEPVIEQETKAEKTPEEPLQPKAPAVEKAAETAATAEKTKQPTGKNTDAKVAEKTNQPEKSKKMEKPAVNTGKKANESANTRSAAPEKARASAKVDKKAPASTARKTAVAPVKAFASDKALPLDQAVPLDRVMRLNQPVIVESVIKAKRPSVAKERPQTEAVVSKPSTRAIEFGSDLGRILRNNFYQ
ncbi:Chemotaxis protein MotB [Oligella ureolytica]|uniref:flagellar motor protein MotB n=1 Tax=Oligella ureolytica TaxID=90244 RepID=UPI000E066606|nr:flagellar motor protein MotB [Oligella ureolytica]SUA55959.1 Chemotaxis protein MotB [Oligella ureolytica]